MSVIPELGRQADEPYQPDCVQDPVWKKKIDQESMLIFPIKTSYPKYLLTLFKLKGFN